MTDDRRDFLAAFAIGAIVGVGAALLLAPSEPAGARRILHEIEPALKRARRKSRRLKNEITGAVRARRRRRRFGMR